MKILHSVEGGDVDKVCSNLETNLPCLRLLISLFLSLMFYILHVLIVLILICLIYLYLIEYMFGLFVCSQLYLIIIIIIITTLPISLIYEGFSEGLIERRGTEIHLLYLRHIPTYREPHQYQGNEQ